MQSGKVIALIIRLLVAAAIIVALMLIGQRPKIKAVRVNLGSKLGILVDNLSQSVFPARRPPLTTIELEENLKVNLAVPFARFTREDWDWFWHLLYGKFVADENGWPRQQRQLSRQEIEQMLTDNYYQPFGYFREKQWGIFWQYLLKGKVFK